MNLLLLTNYFPPEIGAAPHLFFDLGKFLVGKGYNVEVLTGLPAYNLKNIPKEYRGKILFREEMSGMRVLRIGFTHLPGSRNAPLIRGIEHFWLAFAFFIGGLFVRKPDIILLYSPPLTLGLTAWLLSKIKKAPFIINVQDLFPQSAVDLGIIKNKFLINLFRRVEQFIYHKAAFITVHSEQNKEYIKKSGIKADKIKIVHNWVDINFIKPARRINYFRKKYKLGSKFIISFAGVLGYSQDLDVVLEVAKLLRENQDILFLIVGEGPEKGRLVGKAKRMNLGNVKFLPIQPKEVYPKVLQASDVCLVTLRQEVKTPVVPSKILSIMAAGRPLVACMDIHGDAPKIIKNANCGYALPPSDPEKLAKSILSLYKDVELRKHFGYNGRKYCEKNFSEEVCIGKYIKLFNILKRK
jgi:glycosyltransferase involved in cell wall biosynthesis